MNVIFIALLAFTPLALGASFLHASPLIVFMLSAVAIIPLAKFIGDATNALSTHTNPGVGGLLNATFGNSTELVVGILALHAGLITVVKASITGSILSNLLLVLGTAILAGGWKRERQKFNATAAKAAGSMLLLATIGLVIPAVFQLTVPMLQEPTLMQLSVFVAVLMIIAYFAQLFFTLSTHKHLYQNEENSETSKWSVRMCIAILGATTIAVALVSNTLVNSITPLVINYGWNELFIGVIVIAIVGNAAEHTSAIQAALRNRMDLALAISLGSATQIVMFVAPALVLLSLVLGHPMDLVFTLFELIALIFAVFVTNSVIEDGESNWLEGVQLLIAYIIMVVAFFLHP
jgi:Ca2+:H+ antiporter